MATCDCKPPIPPRPPRRHPFPAMSAHFSHTLDDLVEHYVQAQYFEIKGDTVYEASFFGYPYVISATVKTASTSITSTDSYTPEGTLSQATN